MLREGFCSWGIVNGLRLIPSTEAEMVNALEVKVHRNWFIVEPSLITALQCQSSHCWEFVRLAHFYSSICSTTSTEGQMPWLCVSHDLCHQNSQCKCPVQCDTGVPPYIVWVKQYEKYCNFVIYLCHRQQECQKKNKSRCQMRWHETLTSTEKAEATNSHLVTSELIMKLDVDASCFLLCLQGDYWPQHTAHSLHRN